MKKNAREDRKSHIIETGICLFAEKGYYATTLDEIAQRIGVTKAALYYYVKSKEEILREINKRNKARMEKPVRLSKSNLTPRDKLHKLVRYYVSFSAESAEEANILFNQTNSLPKKMRLEITRKKKEVERALQHILKEGVQQGCFDIKNLRITSFAILGLCNWTYHWYHPDGELTPKQIADIFIDFIDKSILVDKNKSDRG